MTDVSIIIVNYNTRELLRACLRSVFDLPHQAGLEVLVIDNASSDGSVEMVRAEFPGVRLTLNSRNEGFARPNNAGMRMAAGRYVLLLNSDTVILKDAIDRLIGFMDGHPEAGACGPRLVYPDGTLQKTVKGFPSLWTHLCDMLLLDKLFPRSRVFARAEMATFSYDRTEDVNHVMAAAFVVRRQVLESVGLFDERFSIYYNDMDWCYRIKAAEWKIFYVPEATVVHHHGQTTRIINRDFAYFEELHNNRMLYFQKMYGRWGVAAAKLLFFVGFLFRSAGWTIARMAAPTEYSRMMFTFSWKTLGYAARFWEPLPYEHRPDDRAQAAYSR